METFNENEIYIHGADGRSARKSPVNNVVRKPCHAMIDLETLGLGPDAVVTEIGCAIFDNESYYQPIEETIEFDIEVFDQIRIGRQIEKSTVDWWAGRDSQRFLSFFNRSTFSVDRALTLLGEFIQSHKPKTIWCNGMTFDFSILHHLHQQYMHGLPWSRKTERDYRTVRQLFRDGPSGEPSHRAVDDAINQAHHLATWLHNSGLKIG